jgi:hypothetical protein
MAQFINLWVINYLLVINYLEAIYKILNLFENYMIKAPLTYHNPLDVYDYFMKNYGSLSMVLKLNYA